MTGWISPEAQKVIENAQACRRRWWPALARTNSKLIVRRPAFGGGRSFAKFMATQLPGFTFNHQRNWWEAPLTRENYGRAVKANSVKLNRERDEVQLEISEGVRIWIGGANHGT